MMNIVRKKIPVGVYPQMLKSRAGMIVLILLLSACSILSPVQNNTTEYRLTCAAHPQVVKNRAKKTLWVALPSAAGLLSGTEMVYTTSPFQVNYFSKTRWADSPAQMLQPLIIDALQKTHYFLAVGSSASIGTYDYALTTDIVQFQQIFYAHYSAFRLTLRVQLMRAVSGKVLRSKELNAEVPAPFYSPYGGVVAANQALARVLTELANWVVHPTPPAS